MGAFKVIASLCLAVPAVMLLAVGPRGKVDAPKNVVVVEYWEKWTGEEGEALKESVNDFNNTVGREKGIYVNVLSTSDIVKKTLISTAGGVPPDVAGLWDVAVAQFASLGAIEPLDDLAAAHGITAASYKKVFWDECHYDGKLYALVSTPYDYALHYNTKIFADSADALRAAGCDPSRPPRTIDELDRYAAALNKVENGQIVRAGYLPLEPGWDLGVLSYWFGGIWWDGAGKKFQFTDPTVVKTYAWVQSYSERLGKAAVADFRSAAGNYDSPQNPFMAGTVAMENQGPYLSLIVHVQQPSLDASLAVAPFPSAVPGENDITYCTADVLVIPKGAKHRREAFEFIAYLNSQPAMEKLCNAHCKISALSHVSENFLDHHKNPYIRVFDRLADGPGARGTPSVPIFPEITEEMNNFVQNLAQLRVTPEAGLAEMQGRLQAKLDRFNAMHQLAGRQ